MAANNQQLNDVIFYYISASKRPDITPPLVKQQLTVRLGSKSAAHFQNKHHTLRIPSFRVFKMQHMILIFTESADMGR